MEPESLVSLLLVVCLLGLAGLGVFVFLFRKKAEERHQHLAASIDSLDERAIQQSSAFEKKTEQLRASILKQTESLEKEREERGAVESEIRSALETFRKTVEGEWLTELRAGIEGFRADHQRIEESMEHYGKKVESVRFRNEIQTAYTLIRSQEFERATTLLESLLNEDPSDREVRLLLSKRRIASGELAAARATLQEGLGSLQGDPDLLAALAHVHGLEKNIPEMARTLTDGLVRHPNHVGLLFERSKLNSQQKKYEAAVADLERILDSGVDSAEIRYNLGLAQVSLGKVSAAIQELRQSVSLDPVSAESNHALGLALLTGHRFKESTDFLERAREYDPQNVPIRLDLSAAYRVSGDPRSALDEASVALELDPHSGRAALEKSLAHHALSEFREALEILDRFLEAHPNFVRARSLKASILHEAGRHSEAAEEWRTLSQQNPNDPNVHARWSEALKRSGRPAEALAVIEAAAMNAPDHPRIQLQWTRECLLQGEYDKVEGVATYIFPKVDDANLQLQFSEIRLLHTLKTSKWPSLIKILEDLKRLVDGHPELVPVGGDFGLSDDELMALALAENARAVHSAFLYFLKGETGFAELDGAVTQLMRSLLPASPKPAPLPEPIPETPPEPAIEDEAVPAPIAEVPTESETAGGVEPVEEAGPVELEPMPSPPSEAAVPAPETETETETVLQESMEEVSGEGAAEAPAAPAAEESPAEAAAAKDGPPSGRRKKRARKSARKQS